MAKNGFNDAFGILLTALKNGSNGNGNGKLKIRKLPEFQQYVNEINAQNWTRKDGRLVIDTDIKDRLLRDSLALSGSVSNKRNVFYDDVEFMREKGSIGNVVKDGVPSRAKPRHSWGKVKRAEDIKYNNKKKMDASLAEGRDNRAYSLPEGSRPQKEVIAAMEKFGEYTPENFIKFQQWNIRTVEDVLAAIPPGMTAGHGKSAKKGGPMTARNLWAEASGDNYSRQHSKDAPDDVLDAIGVDRTWEIAVGKFFNKIPKTEAEQVLDDQDIIQVLAGYDWKTVLEQRKAQNLKLQQPPK
jgi:hypothetical protein